MTAIRSSGPEEKRREGGRGKKEKKGLLEKKKRGEKEGDAPQYCYFSCYFPKPEALC